MKLLKVNSADQFDVNEENQTLEYDLDFTVGTVKFTIIGEAEVSVKEVLSYPNVKLERLDWTIYNEEDEKVNDYNIDLNYESVEDLVREACQI